MDLISKHLQEHHASVLVGAGFSRNAIKIDDSIPDSPNWAELGRMLIEKLTSDSKEKDRLTWLSPLVLAERVDAIYGRSELDHILLSNIRDADYLPSSLHRKLLTLPWSDIFTTNYDTLLERASDELTEQAFTVITCKEDLIGSSGATRIVKLHGSFPSHRPFIISSEDYRTYPRKFAPFVNTVQQSMLENTLCLIGFSGDDPNFENWIGWIWDNLGTENAPNIYLLLHYAPSEAEKMLLFRRKIIPVDLSQLTSDQNTSAIYEAALDYLISQQMETAPDEWDLKRFFHEKDGTPLPMQDALNILQELHQSYPGWITVPDDRLELLRAVKNDAQTILFKYCSKDTLNSDLELEYLYEYDWLREKTLLPPFSQDLKIYHRVLERHSENTFYKFSVQLSLLRGLRESGEWAKWDALQDELQRAEPALNPEQQHQLRWEECLCSQAQYRFQELKQRLDNWTIEPSMSVWVLRKAGLLAEYGCRMDAQTILQQAILNIRRRLTHQRKINLSLLSLESAMMFLQGYISQALDREVLFKKQASEPSDVVQADRRHRALHDQYHVDWETQNNSFIARLEAVWTPFHVKQEQASFDFGRVQRRSCFGEDVEVIRAYAFLRFREETGIPFFINSVQNGNKAACGAAERIACYSPSLSILTLVRADKPKAVEQVVTRGLLSCWTQEEADNHCQFFLDALLRTDTELASDDWFFRESFARLTADVLPEVLSLLCSKCSLPVLFKLLHAIKQIYASSEKLCYSHLSSLTKRLINAYPPERHQEMVRQFLTVPIAKSDRECIEFPDPISLVSVQHVGIVQTAGTSLPEVDGLFSQSKNAAEEEAALDRLLHCLYHGLLTQAQQCSLRDFLWDNRQLHCPKGWMRTVSLDLPAPIDVYVPQYLARIFTESVSGYTGSGIRPSNDFTILREIRSLTLKVPGTFTDEQISIVLSVFCTRLHSLSGNLAKKYDIMGVQTISWEQMYEIAHMLWLLTGSDCRWMPSDADLQCMRDILNVCQKASIRHSGLHCAWNQRLGIASDISAELSSCFRTSDKTCARWGLETLAVGILHPELSMLDESAIRASVDVLAQQIVWGVPRQLDLALQAVKLAVVHKPDLISSHEIEAILSGLSQMEQQTVIDLDDTIETASTKGIVRMNAAALAKSMYDMRLCGDRPEIIDRWMAIINDQNEFAEIRNAK